MANIRRYRTSSWRRRLLAVVVPLLVLAFESEFAAAQGLPNLDEQEKEQAMESFVRVSLSSPLLEPDKKAEGAGVLVTRNGHVLTAFHVVQHALDEQPTEAIGPVLTKAGAHIKVQFLADADKLEETTYDAEVIGVDQKSDIALLKIDSRLPRRILPVLDFKAGYSGGNFAALGYTINRFEYIHGFTAQPVQEDYKRMLHMPQAPGFSGGPVFYRDLDRWYLVGIGTSGDDRDRAVMSFITVLDGANDLLDPMREQLEILEKQVFPSRDFTRWAGMNILVTDEGQLRNWVGDKILDNQSAGEFARWVLAEDLREDASQWEQSRVRLMLEEALRLVGERTIGLDKVQIFRTLSDKLISVYEVLGVDAKQTVNRRREYAKLLWDYCESASRAKTRCWLFVVQKHEQVWREKLEQAYNDALNSQITDWTRIAADQLFEWGNATERLVFQSDLEQLEEFRPTINELTWVKRMRRPARSTDDSLDLTLFASATEKYLEAYRVLSHVRRHPDPANEREKRFSTVCSGISDVLQRLKQAGTRAGADAYVIWAGNVEGSQIAGCRREAL